MVRASFFSCGGRIRTCDLQVMSLASYQLLHSAMLIFSKRVQRYYFFSNYANIYAIFLKNYLFCNISRPFSCVFQRKVVILHTVSTVCNFKLKRKHICPYPKLDRNSST